MGSKRLPSALDGLFQGAYLGAAAAAALLLAWWGALLMLDVWTLHGRADHLVIASLLLFGAWSLLRFLHGPLLLAGTPVRAVAVSLAVPLASAAVVVMGPVGPLPSAL